MSSFLTNSPGGGIVVPAAVSALLLAVVAMTAGCGENAEGRSEPQTASLDRELSDSASQEGRWVYTVVEFELPKLADDTWRIGQGATRQFTAQLNGLAEHGWEYVGPINDAHVLPQHALYYVAFRRLKNGPGALYSRAFARAGEGDYEGALAIYREAIGLRDEYASAHYQLSWLLATCPANEIRDGKGAVEHALRVCNLTDWDDPSSLDTLAAAYAEAGSFGEAVKWQKEAMAKAPNAGTKEEYQSRLTLYETGQPYRDER
ncbi:MAG: hypothetical protein ACYS0G_14610 [Planctomycetota bacterium]|jgi:tetratricopeptide (TPR) repeat protein